MPKRIYQIAKELNISADDIVNFLQKQGFSEVKNYLSPVDEKMLELINRHYKHEREVAERQKKKRAKEERQPKEIETKPVVEEAKTVEVTEVAEDKSVQPVTEIEPTKEEKEVVEVQEQVQIEQTVVEEITLEEVEEKIGKEEKETVELSEATAQVEETVIAQDQSNVISQAQEEEKSSKDEAILTEPELKSSESERLHRREEMVYVKVEERRGPKEKKFDRDRERSRERDRKRRERRGEREPRKIEGVRTRPVKEEAVGGIVHAPEIETIKEETRRKKQAREKEEKKKKFVEIEDIEIKKPVKKTRKSRIEINEEEILRRIDQTLAEMEDAGPDIREIIKKRKKKERQEKEEKKIEQIEREKRKIKVAEFITVNELANLIGVSASEIIKKCLNLGLVVSINQRLDFDTITLIASDYGFEVERAEEYLEDIIAEEPDKPEDLEPRPPVVTIMGHVDHGKTTLLDYIRQSNIVAGEAGGITQHIGAYQVTLPSGKQITFIDTPGHEAFTAMRARGAQVTDIVVLVVAADDAVMPQTVEAINHALAANVPIIVAINKIDKPEANPDKIRQQLAERGVLVEDWGGKYQCVEISAKYGKNVDLLLEKILLEAELMELKANPKKKARGVVIESKLDKGRGPVGTVLVQNGTLKIGDIFVAGTTFGRVRAMFDERGNRVEIAKPSTPVQVIGFDQLPEAGDSFVVVDDEKVAREIANKRAQLKREQTFRQLRAISLNKLSEQIKEGKVKELPVIIKADVNGSVEALTDSLMKISTQEVKVRIIHRAVGAISESDVLLAQASGAIIIGFNVRPTSGAKKLAESENVEIRLYNIIYNVIEDVKKALEGMLEPEKREEFLGTAEVRETFKISKVGTVAGCFVTEGKILRNARARLIRNGIVIYDGKIASLKRFKDDVKEVEAGLECGIALENYNDIKVGDVIEAYNILEIKRKLEEVNKS
ncbi:MAG: translation initiation factor IF-2 [Candidatus Kryptonium sp.]|nr:translation initiation factor IF-2 [Candidatus Kryptonium sp.]MCX7762900.1 translation initiation factor IF-2 [Candidatus Kryptonium sp.]MDW8109432.1 translation initiation factor IF-2 [Candidatus Kryptonium sp.]